MEFICIVIPSGEQTHFLLICFTYSHSLLFLMDNEWKHSPVGISTAFLETDVLETTDKLPVTVRPITHASSQSGPNPERFCTSDSDVPYAILPSAISDQVSVI